MSNNLPELIADIKRTNREFIAIQEGHSTDFDDDYTPEANTKDGLIPNSYITEDGRRKAVVWELGLPERMRLIKTKEGWQLIDRPIF